MAILLISGISIPIVTADSNQNAPTVFTPQPATFTGSPSAFLSGPTLVSVSFGSPSSDPASDPGSGSAIPYHNPKPDTVPAAGDPPALSPTVPPVVNCPAGGLPLFGSGCDTISTRADGAKTNPLAMNALDSSPFTVEPPDQGMCAGNGYVMEVLNQGELQVYGSGLSPVSGVVPLDSLMGLTTLGWSSGGDPMCVYDYGNGGHWFISEIVSTSTEGSGGPFSGCFAGATDGCREGIAVSTTNNPMGAYNVYFLDPNTVNTDPGSGYLLNDFAKTATTADAYLLFYDEFNLNGATIPACPSFGCFGFNGAQEFAFSKTAMELGLAPTDPSFNVAYENMGTAPNLYPIPANGAFQSSAASCFSGALAGAVCWYQVIPAQTPDPSQYNNRNGGTGYMVASLDFLGAGDDRIATFEWTGLSNLNSASCGSCGGIAFGGQLFTTQVSYLDEGAVCYPSQGSFCGLGAQAAGPTPLGDSCSLITNSFTPLTSPCPESGIATNGDGTTEASYAQGQIWTSVSTQVNQTFSQFGHGGKTTSELHMGVTYWVIGSRGHGNDASLQIQAQGYVSASHEDLEFPSIAATDGGGAVMAFTLSGNGGPTAADNGGFYPSTAYGLFVPLLPGLFGNTIHIADLGKSPQDGFSEYQTLPPFGATRPRWGDYSQAIFVPSSPGSGFGHGFGGGVYFATEYIQSPNCSDSAFASDPTCGGTRAPNANWGSSINFISTP